MAGHDAALGVQLDEHFTREASDDRVGRRLDARQTDIVEPDVPEHVRQQLPLRIEATALLDEADALEVERAHPPLLVGRDLANDPRELSLAAQAPGNRVALCRITAIESGTHARRHRVDVLNLGRVGDHRIGVHGIGEQVAVAVDDVAAAASRLDRVLALLLRALHHRVVANDLKIEEPRFDRASPQRTDHGADHEPRAERVPPVGDG